MENSNAIIVNPLPESAVIFLRELQANNNKPWFLEHKPEFDAIFDTVKIFFKSVYEQMQTVDHLERFHVHRIYRDVRFAKDKTPYKNYFGLHLARAKPLLRGGYYLNIEPGNSFVGGGFWEPNKDDLLRIRKEIALDDSEIRKILAAEEFKKYFGTLSGEALKTAPKGFDKAHPAIDLLRKKQYLVMRSFSDEQIMAPEFHSQILETFQAMRPLFDYFSEVLTSDVNGESLFS